MNANTSFKLAFVGCGSYGRLLARAALRSDCLTVSGCCDSIPDAAATFAEEFGCPPFPDLDTMFARTDAQAAVIATPNNAHRANAEAAAAAGKHIFIEKPIANTLDDARAIIEAAARNGSTLSIGHNGRRNGGHRAMKRLLEEGAIGTPLSVEANFSHSGGLNLAADAWRASRDQCPALPLMQLGIHFADTIRYLLGDVASVSSFMSRVCIAPDNVDTSATILRLESGAVGYLGSNYASPPVYYVNVYGTGGNLYCSDGVRLRIRSPGSSAQEEIAVEEVDTQKEELEEFARCCLTGEPPEVDGDTGLRALALVQAALLSDRERRAVEMGELIP